MGIYLTDEEYNKVFSLVPRICVDFVIKNKKGTLLTLRKIEPYKGMWHLPGGRIRKDETIEQAIKRISKDELGVELLGGRFMGVCEFFEEKDFIHTVSILYYFEETIENHHYTKIPPIKTVEEHRKWIK